MLLNRAYKLSENRQSSFIYHIYVHMVYASRTLISANIINITVNEEIRDQINVRIN